MKTILLAHGEKALVDDEDYEDLAKFRWHFFPQKYGGYAVRGIITPRGKRKVGMHRQILKPPPHLFVDHINGNGLDNRKSNLRVCTKAENTFNKHIGSSNSSGYKGVSWDRRKKKWRTMISFQRQPIHVGNFTNKIDAARAYDVAAQKYFGKFARTNF